MGLWYTCLLQSNPGSTADLPIAGPLLPQIAHPLIVFQITNQASIQSLHAYK